MNSSETPIVDWRCAQTFQYSRKLGFKILVVLVISAITGSAVFVRSNSLEWLVIATAVASIIVGSLLVIGHQFNDLSNS